MVFTFQTCGDQVKPNVYGAIVLKYVKHKAIWLLEKVTDAGTKTFLRELFEHAGNGAIYEG
jgi:hypothetical protein